MKRDNLFVISSPLPCEFIGGKWDRVSAGQTDNPEGALSFLEGVKVAAESFSADCVTAQSVNSGIM